MTQKIKVSDHAVVRYLERVRGQDVESVRAHIAGLIEKAVEMGACAVTIDGMTYKIADATCVTVRRRKSRPLRQSRVTREADE